MGAAKAPIRFLAITGASLPAECSRHLGPPGRSRTNSSLQPSWSRWGGSESPGSTRAVRWER